MRLLQILALSAFALLSIRLMTLAATGFFDGIAVTQAQAQDAKEATTSDEKAEVKAEEKDKEPEEKERVVSETAPTEQPVNTTSSRDALVARLSERRDNIDKRERDLKLREELLKAAEKRLKAKIEALEKQKSSDENKEENGKTKQQNAKDLVTIYENMKPKDAAKIFNTLSLDIAYNLATRMNPRKMSSVLAEMDVKSAERLTVEMAARGFRKQRPQRKLKKIGG